MTRADDTTRLRHMLDSAREAKMMASGRTRQDLDTDRQFNLAMTRLMEIVGEAAGRVSEATRSRYSAIPWSQIVALRNRLIHGYDEVDFDILWEVLQTDLSTLIERLEQIITLSIMPNGLDQTMNDEE